MTKAIHGKVHGRTITLDEDPGIEDGQEVSVLVTLFDHSSSGGKESNDLPALRRK